MEEKQLAGGGVKLGSFPIRRKQQRKQPRNPRILLYLLHLHPDPQFQDQGSPIPSSSLRVLITVLIPGSRFYTVKYGVTFSSPHERVHNGLVPARRPYTVHLPSSYRVLTVCHRLYPHGESFGHAQNFRRVSPAANGPPTCSPIAQLSPRRVPSPCSTIRTKFTTRWHTVGLAGTV